ncbi:MAG TPA: hypothetical protein VGH89_13400 [Pseudonocardia sp.]|jgi:hypothetical protein
MPIPPVEVPVNLTGQWILTVGVICGLGVVLVAAVRLGRRLGSWAPVTMVAGSLLAGFIEPIYCITMHLWYYRPGQWTMITALGNSQPVWSWLSYGAFYGGLSLLVWWRIEKGATRSDLLRLGGLLLLVGALTEIVCIKLGTYEYYGPHPFRVASFPLWIAVANASVGLVAGIIADRLRPLLPGPQVIAYLALVPGCMTMIQFGTGFLTLDAINTPNPPMWLLYGLAVVSMALAGALSWCALRLVPATREPVSGEHAPDPAHPAVAG